jgi:short subunit dehydrogenase-like uncharacterized protein
MSGPRLLLYGATGNSGTRIAEALAPLGDRLLLGGRDGDALHALGKRLGVSVRRFGLEDPALLPPALGGVDVVLNAAGPYAATALPMARACIAAGIDYLDLSGEWTSFEALLTLDEQAEARGVMLLPGVAVAILVSDCLLAAAARLFPKVAALRLGLSRPHILGRGSIRTTIGLADTHALVRVDGALQRVPAHRQIRDFDFGAGLVRAAAFSWPDVMTVERSTGVGTYAAYVEAAPAERAAYGMAALAAPVLRHPQLAPLLSRSTGLWPRAMGPTYLAGQSQTMVAEAEDPWRRTASLRLSFPDAYTITTEAASAAARAVLAGKRQAGFRTPSQVFGPDFLETLTCIRLERGGASGRQERRA